MRAIIICDRDGWSWQIEEQEGCSEGVDLIYKEHNGATERRCIGSTADAEALANAILTYIKFKRENAD